MYEGFLSVLYFLGCFIAGWRLLLAPFRTLLLQRHPETQERMCKRELRNSYISVSMSLFTSNAGHVTRVALEDGRTPWMLTRHDDDKDQKKLHKRIPNHVFILSPSLLSLCFPDSMFFSCAIIANVCPNNGRCVWLSTTTITCLCFGCVKFKKWETIVGGRPAAMFDLWNDFTSPIVWNLHCGWRERAATQMLHIIG